MNASDAADAADAAAPFYDIVIVGAGPVGLTLAALLRHGERSVLLVERRTAPFEHPRAMHLDRSSVDLLRAAGVVWRPGVDLDELTGVSFDGPVGASLPIVLGGLCPDELAPFAFAQPAVEAGLRAVLTGSAVHRRAGAELAALVPTGRARRSGGTGALLAELREGTARRGVRTDLLIGCDGADSTVRRLAGLPSRTWGGTALWTAEDHALAERRTDRVVRHRLGPQPSTVVPGCATHVRIERCLQHSHGAPVEPELDEGPALAELLGGDSVAVIASRSYAFRTRLAPVPGRMVGDAAVIVAGDAAHTVAPFLGQGLGLGLRDAASLAALLLDRGAAGPAQLLAAHARARRADVLATALQARAAQLLIERGAALGPAALGRTLRILAGATGRAPGLVRRAALAHRPPLALSAAAPSR